MFESFQGYCVAKEIKLFKTFYDYTTINLTYFGNVIFRYPEAFELSTCKNNNREYLFAASTPQERKSWMVALAKVRDINTGYCNFLKVTFMIKFMFFFQYTVLNNVQMYLSTVILSCFTNGGY